MNLDLILTLGIIVLAGIFLISRFGRKSSGCCGCTGCANDLRQTPSCDCPSKKN